MADIRAAFASMASKKAAATKNAPKSTATSTAINNVKTEENQMETEGESQANIAQPTQLTTPKELSQWLLSQEQFQTKDQTQARSKCATFLVKAALHTLENNASALQDICASLIPSGSASEGAIILGGVSLVAPTNGTVRGDTANSTNGSSKKPNDVEALGQPLLSNGKMLEAQVSCLTPRGKFTIRLHENGLCLTSVKNTKETIVVSHTALPIGGRNVVVFPKPEQCKQPPKPAEHEDDSEDEKKSKKKKVKKAVELIRLVLIPLSSKEDDVVVTHTTYNTSGQQKSKRLTQIGFPLPVGIFDQDNTEQAVNGGITELDWVNALKDAFHLKAMVDIPYTQLSGKGKTQKVSMFESVGPSSNPAMPFVSCHSHVNQGHLFPLQQGLLFYKPPQFLPRHTLSSIACGRGGGGSSNTRFVDLTLTLDNGEAMEFNNIAREELQPMKDYISYTLMPAMAQDAEIGEDEVNEEISKSKSESSSGGRKRSSSEEATKESRAKKVKKDNAGVPVSPAPAEAANGASGRKMRSRRKAAMEAVEMTRQQMEAVNQNEKESTLAAKACAVDSDEDDDEDDNADYEAPSCSDEDNRSDDSDESSLKRDSEVEDIPMTDTESENEDEEK
jgi:hypothetical protein